MYSMLTFSFHDQGLSSVVLESSSTTHGPCSLTAALLEGAPGPPENQTVRGAVLWSPRAWKNQKYMCAV